MSMLLICMILVASARSQKFRLISQAYEAGSPCESRVLTMSRLIGGPPSKENYWDGTVNLAKYNLSEARVTLRLTAPATLTLDEEDGEVLTNDGAFYLTFYKKDDGSFRAKFRVQGRPKKDFPNLDQLILNEVDICPTKKEWKPILLGTRNIGSVDPITDTDTTDSAESVSVCGRRLVQHEGLITNGFASQEGEWPWHAALYHIESAVSKYKCGATLISSESVLTASHCVSENGNVIIPNRLLVKLGLHNRLLAGPYTHEYRVYKVISHEDFNIGDLRNDIALLKLATEVQFTNYIQPACLWDRSKTDLNEVVNRIGSVIGWGFNEHDSLTDILSQGTMPVVSLTTCLHSNRPFFGNFLSDKNFCAGFRNGTSVCNGDSGGGMFFKVNNVFRLRGIVSLSVTREDKNICNTKYYVVFTDVAKYLDWIEANM